MVFGDSVGGQLYAKERDQVEPVALTGTAGVRSQPTFSPDGAWIAFVTSDNKVKKIPRLGGLAIPLADSANGNGLAWLDGGTLLYSDQNQGVRAVNQDGSAPLEGMKVHDLNDPADLVIYDIGGLPGGHAGLPDLHPCPCSESVSLRVLDLRSGKITLLQEQAVRGWALPGGVVAFVRQDGGVFAAPFDMSRLAFTRAPMPMMDGVRAADWTADMAVSANGTAIYVADTTARREAPGYQPVWVTRTGAWTPIDTAWTVPMNGTNCTCDGSLALSPDGSSRR